MEQLKSDRTQTGGIKWLHRVGGLLGFTIVLAFISSTLTVELIGDHALILKVKRWIAAGLLVLVPALACAGGTGRSMANQRRGSLVLAKQRRMKFIAQNGALVLAPCAIALWQLAERGRFDGLFAAVQTLELAGGALNLFLMTLMIRDGLRLSGRLRYASRRAHVPS